MNLYKLILHDIRNGLFRKQYFFVLPIIAIPCIVHLGICNQLNLHGGWIDYMMYCFRGMEIILSADSISHFQLPIIWLLVMIGGLFLNLEYPLRDLSNFGLQVMIRSNSRHIWYLSKCCWNTMSCSLYILLTCLVCLFFTIITGGSVTVQINSNLTTSTFALASNVDLCEVKALLITVLCPAFNLCALSQIQMLLGFVSKPILGFISSIGLLILSVYWSSPFAIGSGAMIIRSSYLVRGGVNPMQSIIAATIVIIVCAIVGSVYFRRKDILGSCE